MSKSKPFWYIQDSVFEPEEIERLIASLKKHGNESSVQPHFYSTTPPVEYVLHGSINAARWLMGNVTPNPWLEPYKWSNYMRRITKKFSEDYISVLNRIYCCAPAKQLNDPGFHLAMQRIDIDSKRCFLRPDSGEKQFTAGVVNLESDDISQAIGKHNLENNIDCVVCRVQENILSEARYIISHGKVITGSLYARHGEIEFQNLDEVRADQQRRIFAAAVAEELAFSGLAPDAVYVMDIAEIPYQSNPNFSQYTLLECNHFFTSGFYECNTDKIVEEYNRVAGARLKGT